MSRAKTFRPETVAVRQLSPSGVSDRTIVTWVRSARERLPARSGTISVVMVGPKQSRHLNRHYRRHDRATNVLSFSLGDRLAKLGNEVAWGELILCPAVIRREVRQFGGTYRAYLRFLIHHGMIHLLGLDHQTPVQQRRWNVFERRLA